jgi:hypothetical protein
MERPYSQIIENDVMIRKFSDDIDPIELKWHRDKKDRTVIALNENDWKLQLDNELPKCLAKNEKIFIPKEMFHRVIKGTSELIIKILE